MHIFRLLTASASALALAACTVGPNYLAPGHPATASGAFISASPAVSTAQPVAGNWWRLYNDPVLDGLVADALAHNTDIRVAIANLAKARASLREVRPIVCPKSGCRRAALMAARRNSNVVPTRRARAGRSMRGSTCRTRSICSAA